MGSPEVALEELALLGCDAVAPDGVAALTGRRHAPARVGLLLAPVDVRCRGALSNDLADGPLCSLTRFDRLDPGGQRRGRRRRQRERRHPRATRGTAGAERRFPDHPTLPPIFPARPALLPTLTTSGHLSPRGVFPPRVAGRPAPGVALRDGRATPTRACRFTRPGTV